MGGVTVLITRKKFQELEQDFHYFSSAAVVSQIRILDYLLNDEQFIDSLFIDDAIRLRELLFYECMYRMPFVPDSCPSMV